MPMSHEEKLKYLVPLPMLRTDALDFQEWIRRAEKSYLRIRDIMNLRSGAKIKVLLLDRNTSDVTNQKQVNPSDTPTRPCKFFKTHYAIYTHKKVLSGTMMHSWQKKTDRPYDFEWDVEYLHNQWYPLTNGLLPALDMDFYKPLIDGRPRHWTELPDAMPVGWRGPAILWSMLKNLASVYWHETS